MARTTIMGFRSSTRAAASTFYYPMAIAGYSGLATEANAQVPWRQAGTFSMMSIQSGTNGVTASTTCTVRINGANGNLNITIPSSTTGFFQDTTDSDTIASGDLVCHDSIVGASGTNINMTAFDFVFNATSNTHVRYCGDSASTSVASTTYYIPLSGTHTLNTVEASAQATFPKSGTLKNGAAQVSANTRSTTTTLVSRINAATGNISVAITASTTGLFEDTTNTDSISAGDEVNSAVINGTGGASATFAPSFGFDGGGYIVMSGSVPSGSTITTGTPTNNGLAGRFLNLATTVYSNIPLSITSKLSRLFSYVLTNAATTGSMVIANYRYTGITAGNMALTIGFGATGLFEDTTNNDISYAADGGAFYRSTNSTDAGILVGTIGSSMTVTGENLKPFPFIYTTGNMEDLTAGMRA